MGEEFWIEYSGLAGVGGVEGDGARGSEVHACYCVCEVVLWGPDGVGADVLWGGGLARRADWLVSVGETQSREKRGTDRDYLIMGSGLCLEYVLGRCI